jgi:hypothetical protein
MSFAPKPAPAIVNPAPRHPGGARTWRLYPSARCPNVAPPIPAVITSYPDVTAPRRWARPSLYQRPRGADLNIDLRVGRSGGQRDSKASDSQKLLHDLTLRLLAALHFELFHLLLHLIVLLFLSVRKQAPELGAAIVAHCLYLEVPIRF